MATSEFHHLGVPTSAKHDDETYIAGGKVYATNPELILADEPAAGLTEKEGNFIFRILSHQARNYEATLVITSRYSGIQEIFRNRLKLENV